ncbi:MAG: hypothetical protein ACKV22_40195 [Bryobacteraceae bacterium]
MDPRFVRLLAIAEFLLALGVVFIAWPQIGGQNHVDLIDWYWKALLGGLIALAVARATLAAVAEDSAWNRRLLGWILVIVVTVVAMGFATYDAHLNEPADDSVEMGEDDSGAVRSL